MENRIRILIADDEPDILEILRLLLEGEGYEVTAAADGREAVQKADASVDLYILDIHMPVMSGFAAAMEIRRKFLAPVLFLTAYSGEADKAMGFAAGADDYVVKPFSNRELLLRVRSLLRRYKEYGARNISASSQEKKEIVYKDRVLDLESQSVKKEGMVIVLTSTEFRILKLLLTHRKKIYSADSLYSSVWEEDGAVGDGAIMAHIKNLRKKLGDSSRNPQYIRTAWGKGYYVD